MGLTFGNILRIVRDMKTTGQIGAVDPGEAMIAVLVLDRLVGERPEAFRDAQIDWDALIEFLERLIPLILRIIDLIWS